MIGSLEPRISPVPSKTGFYFYEFMKDHGFPSASLCLCRGRPTQGSCPGSAAPASPGTGCHLASLSPGPLTWGKGVMRPPVKVVLRPERPSVTGSCDQGAGRPRGCLRGWFPIYFGLGGVGGPRAPAHAGLAADCPSVTPAPAPPRHLHSLCPATCAERSHLRLQPRECGRLAVRLWAAHFPCPAARLLLRVVRK